MGGERFLVQGGDCAERFIDCAADRLEAQVKLILQMGMVTEHVTEKPAVCICRIAGQYGKPRSKPTETVEGVGEVMSYKGDNINGVDLKDRKWNPERLLQGYFHSAATLNFLRAYTMSADPMALSKIKLTALQSSPKFDAMKATAREIGAKYMSGAPVEFFTAHEALQLDNAHVEYFRGISNPIGCKIGPSMKAEELQDLVKVLNPNKEEGRLTLITRYGAGKVEDMLPTHIEAVKATGVPVVWQCDAVHGNGMVAKSNNMKTRHMDDIVAEIVQCIKVHKRCGSVLGGIHVEATGRENVTECLGGCVGITEDMLRLNYETYCDPRLNYAQSIEMSFKVAEACESAEKKQEL